MARTTSFLDDATATPDAQALYDSDQRDPGFVMNLTRVWAHEPALKQGVVDLLERCVRSSGLTFRQRGILVTAGASTMGDSYCSLAWGGKLAAEAGGDLAAAVLRGDDADLDPAERALARWARQVAGDPNATTAGDVDALRQAGFDDAQIFAITTFVALRLAFSTVNDALGVLPDHELLGRAPTAVSEAVTFGRPVGPPSPG
jgi:uncharacterized peroxidase-related enzyme